MPRIMRIGKGDEPLVLAQIRRDLQRTYAEHAETVLIFMLKS
jgi:hypothetical protein